MWIQYFVCQISLTVTWLPINLATFIDNQALYSLNWQEFNHDPSPAEYEIATMRTNQNELYNCHVPTKVIEKFNASDTFVVNEAALEAARWLLLPLLSTESPESPIEEPDEDTCWQLLTTASVPGEFWQRSRDVVYKLCSIAHGGQVQLLSQDGSSGVWNIGGFPDGGDVADEIAAALRPGPPGSFVEVDSRHRLAFVELTLDSGGDACPDDPGVNLSTILRFACGTKPGLVSAVQPGPCRHRLLLLTPLLCGQPAFRPRPARLNRIACRRVSPKSGAKSGPPRSLAELEASRDHVRLSSLLLGSRGSSGGTSKLRLGVGDASSETVIFWSSNVPWLLDDEETDDN
uniref:HECT domain-containing protein n=1 Tax=Macrostomum lignano TaxID=282301 RepID=A0A1I8GK28_9PLAT